MDSKLHMSKLGPENMNSFGNLLQANLASENKGLLNLDNDTKPEVWDSVAKAITKLLTDLGIDATKISETKDVTNRVDIVIGDILTQTNNNRIYIVTGFERNTPRTFPFLTPDDKLLFSPIYAPPVNIKRLDFTKIEQRPYEQFVTTNITPILELADVNGSYFEAGNLNSESTHLQIGDLIFGVDPIQISFTTQNGYQIFPTLRSDGNPKLSTGQQVKNINVSLIFPNVDAINYQLIPLYAMFRRAPFVNIKNREISKFFTDLLPHDTSDWISVALESINIQSIDGFPNSLQADVSFLPFDSRTLGNTGLKALLTINDVIEQQEERNADPATNSIKRLLAFKQGGAGVDSDSVEDLVIKDIKSSPDFRESFPFRSFYQSLIETFKGVKNEDGSDAKSISSSGTKTDFSDPVFFEKFRPVNSENMLSSYSPEANQSKVSLTYSYIPKDYLELAKDLKRDRQKLLMERVHLLTNYVNEVKNYKDLANTLIPFFMNIKDVLREEDYILNTYENTVLKVFQDHGYTIDKDKKTIEATKNIFTRLVNWVKGLGDNNVFVKEGLHNIGVFPAVQAFSDLSALSNPDSRKKIGSAIQNWLFGGTLTVAVPNTGEVSGQMNQGLDAYFKELYDSTEGNAEQRKALISVLDDIATRLADPVQGWRNSLSITEGLGGKDSSGFDVERLPLFPKTIVLDNKYDVITAWNVTFSNKFVPFYLQLNKYPFYQHLGFDDATLSLRVISVPRPPEDGTRYDLKAELSAMSDRMAESTKVVTYSAPELSIFLDPRVTINSKPNSIFNALGIKKVVLNSSNTTNRQGQPDSWNTVINFTHAKFTVDQYHSIEHIPNLAPVEGMLLSVILRLKKDLSGKFVLKRYCYADGTEPDLQSLMFMSFIDSTPGREFEEELAKLAKVKTTSEKLKGEIESKTKKLLDSLDMLKGWSDIDTKATGALNQLLKETQFSPVLETIFYNYDQLLIRQADLLRTLFSKKQNEFLIILNHFFSSFGKGGIAFVAIDLVALLLAVLTAPAWITTAMVVAGLVVGSTIFFGGTIADSVVDIQSQNFKEDAGALFYRMGESIKRELLFTLSHQVAKDPLIREKLLSKDLLFGDRLANSTTGEDPLSQLKKDEAKWNGFNCYPDFDLRPTVATVDKREFRLAPDFYLAITDLTKSDIRSYLKDSFESILRTNQAAMELSMLTKTQNVIRFDNIIKFVKTGEKNELITEDLLKKLKERFGYDDTGLNASLRKSVTDYITMVLQGTTPNTQLDFGGEGTTPANSPSIGIAFIPAEKQQPIRQQLKDLLSKKTIDQKEYDELSKLLDDAFIGDQTVFHDRDSLKFNYIVAQRDIIIMELLELFYSISSYLSNTGRFQGEGSKSSETNAIFKKLEQLRGDTKQVGQSDIETASAMKQLVVSIGAVLTRFDSLTTTSTQAASDADLKEIKDQIFNTTTHGISNKTEAQAGLSLPELRILQNMVFNKIGYFIRLNTAVEQSNAKASSKGMNGEINLDTLPELAFLDYFNRREMESSFRKLRITESFEDNLTRQASLSSRIYPTFKIFFVEEDGKTNTLDDCYAFNAVQSIEIVKNKNMASSTAVLRLSNLTGSITDRLSLHRETRDFLNPNQSFAKDEVFFGTLNIKPGCKILIKLGYGTSDTHLKTVFTGRILEMNVGPMTEIICQSFGAQLRSELYADNFGMFSGVKEHGDIASVLLDKIPGLENYGSKELFSIIGSTSGKQFKNVRRNIFDRFILTNLLSRVSGSTYSSDNPRDENIYLPYDLSTITKWDPLFIWKVYKQSVWEALQELCLYNVNTEMVIRPYNNDGISSRSEQRETIVIGKKSGYYKSTDSFALSSLDFVEIESRIKQYNEINDILSNPSPSLNTYTVTQTATGAISTDVSNVLTIFTSNIVNPSNSKFVLNPRKPETILNFTLNSAWAPVWNFFNDKTNYVIIGKYLLGKINVGIEQASDIALEYLKIASEKSGFSNSLTPEEAFLAAAANFLRNGSTIDPIKGNLYTCLDKLESFEAMLFAAKYLHGKKPGIFGDLRKEEFYDVRVLTDNNDSRLIADPRYQRIQKHHFISDSHNLLNNNIMLNAGFANMVNLYYFDNPKMIDDAGLTTDQIKKINVWSVKAFRDIKDEFIRPLNSYQKNIDTSWMDIAKTESFFKNGFTRIDLAAKSKGQKDVKGSVEAALSSSFKEYGNLNLNSPDWRAFPSFLLVGVNLLKKQVEQMYRGTVQVIGDPNIEPMDILHIDDLLSDVQGAVEVEEVIHTFTPDQGFTTTITPCLITYDRDPQQLEDSALINKVFQSANTHRKVNVGKAAVGSAAALIGGGALALGGKPIAALAVGAIAAPFAFSGIAGMTTGYHRFLYDAMMEIMGGDVINFTALMMKGMPFMCGFDGVDYTSLKTLINHKSQRVNGFINRISAASDPYAAWLTTGFQPGDYGLGGMILSKIGWLRNMWSLKTSENANESIGLFDILFGANSPGEYFK